MAFLLLFGFAFLSFCVWWILVFRFWLFGFSAPLDSSFHHALDFNAL
ncbi:MULTISPECIES: hypothetical protein [unclassified Helicobacter]|nr:MULTISPECIES: hypothetical protein [unclassified Helicobacter]